MTCSLDKTIKTWDINSSNSEPSSCIRTTYPVWRARNLPFGEGILSLPQRGVTTLEMYAKSKTQNLVETFEGHSDVVKEFVWRKGKQDDFQLITWSKDRTLRFWPIDQEVMQKVGHTTEVMRGRPKLPYNEAETTDTFSLAPDVDQQDYFPTLSVPLGLRSILAEVKAPHPPQAIPQPTANASPSHTEHADATPTLTNKPMISARSTGGTMSKGNTGPKSVAHVDPLAWISNVKVGSKRGSSSGGGSGGGGSGAPSRLNSRSRPPSGPDRSMSEIGSRQRSGSLSRAPDDRRDGDGNQSLQDE